MHKYIFPDSNAVIQLLRPFYPPADRGLAERVLVYLELLFKWNTKLNLTAVKSPVLAITKHFGESFLAATVLPMDRGVLVDVGSGAGFPGLALKLACPRLTVVLLEPNLKKCAFLAEVARTLKLEGVRVLPERSDQASIKEASADFVTFRAVGEHEKLLSWSQQILNPQGKVIAWLGANDAARLKTAPGWKITKEAPIPGQTESHIFIFEQK